jgi:hypothetical protein
MELSVIIVPTLADKKSVTSELCVIHFHLGFRPLNNKKKIRGFGPLANHADRATAANKKLNWPNIN